MNSAFSQTMFLCLMANIILSATLYMFGWTFQRCLEWCNIRKNTKTQPCLDSRTHSSQKHSTSPYRTCCMRCNPRHMMLCLLMWRSGISLLQYQLRLFNLLYIHLPNLTKRSPIHYLLSNCCRPEIKKMQKVIVSLA